MAKHQMPFELVFKRGGDTPKEVRSWHLTKPGAETEARAEMARQRSAGWTFVWLAYDLWDHSGTKPKRIVHGKTLQRPS